ncbi:MAG: hypothetical protein HY063_09400 [Bacteroidetes bacterium]|nr:hypothetical protein [Bacteroidota bacterium]
MKITEITKASIKQKEFIAKESAKKLEAIISDFRERYKNSQSKQEFYSDTIRQCWSILFGKIPNEVPDEKGIRPILWRGGFFERWQLKTIQSYAYYKKIGKEPSYIYTTTPDYPADEIGCYVYTEALWNYLRWLKRFSVRKGAKKIRAEKNFYEYLHHDKRELLAKRLKEEFNKEKGKGLALMRKVLEENQPPLLIIPDGEITSFFDSMKNFLDGNIGCLNGFKDFKYINEKHNTAFGKTKQRINNLLVKLV